MRTRKANTMAQTSWAISVTDQSVVAGSVSRIKPFAITTGDNLKESIGTDMDDKIVVKDEVLAGLFAIAADPETLYGSEGSRKAFVHKLLAAHTARSKRPAQCMFRGCEKVSIKRSHTIQKSGPIKHLLEDHHVLTPVRGTTGDYELEHLGARDASTFPGFCPDHEAVFQSFESNALIASDEDVSLQIFRTICREIHRSRAEERSYTEMIEDRKARLVKAAERAGLNDEVKIQSVVSVDPDFAFLRDRRDTALRLAHKLEGLHDLHFAALDGKSVSGLHSFAYQTNMSLPVALSGTIEFFGQDKLHTMIGAVITQPAGSLVYLAGHPDDASEIDNYKARLRSDLDMIDLVETWMVWHTDHWFLRPSVWQKIPAPRQSQILTDMLTKAREGLTYDRSIFDDLRREALTIPPHITLSPAHEAKFAEQMAKLA